MSHQPSDIPDVTTWDNVWADWMEQIIDIESQLWAPWLAASRESLIGRSKVFSAGQLVAISKGKVLGTLSLNQIKWDSDVPTSWNDVAGEPSTYQNTFMEDGDSLVMMSMNCIAPWTHPLLVSAAKSLSKKKNISNIIGSFRPNQFHQFVLEEFRKTWEQSLTQQSVQELFERYLNTKDDKGRIKDQWIWILSHKYNMRPFQIDVNAMNVETTLEEFEMYQNQDQSRWIMWKKMWDEQGIEIWWCGQTWFWYVNRDKNEAIYRESNVWWILQEPVE